MSRLRSRDKTTVQITLPNGSRTTQPGTLDFSDVAVNAATGAVNLRALVPNPKHRTAAGHVCDANVTLGEQNNVFLIPQQAVQRDTVGAYALVVGPDGKVVRKDVDHRR